MRSNDFGGVQQNVLGGPLGRCSDKPLTGFFRDGCCNTSDEDLGSHTVCVVLTDEFLEFSNSRRLTETIFRRHVQSLIFPDSNPDNAGVCAPPAGAKP